MTTKIQWCDETWNPITGCDPNDGYQSESCVHCYARRMANRLKGRFGYDKDKPFKVTFHKDKLNQPLKWKKPRRIFVCSMGDLFHKDVKDEWLDSIWSRMAKCPQHTFLILTKRPERMARFVSEVGTFNYGILPNLWVGVTAENQRTADERIPILLRIPAEVRFVSCEPMLGLISIQKYSKGLGWVICGGETGPGARRMKALWACVLSNQCFDAKIPFFFKQWGSAYRGYKKLYVQHCKEFPVIKEDNNG